MVYTPFKTKDNKKETTPSLNTLIWHCPKHINLGHIMYRHIMNVRPLCRTNIMIAVKCALKENYKDEQ